MLFEHDWYFIMGCVVGLVAMAISVAWSSLRQKKKEEAFLDGADLLKLWPQDCGSHQLAFSETFSVNQTLAFLDAPVEVWQGKCYIGAQKCVRAIFSPGRKNGRLFFETLHIDAMGDESWTPSSEGEAARAIQQIAALGIAGLLVSQLQNCDSSSVLRFGNRAMSIQEIRAVFGHDQSWTK